MPRGAVHQVRSTAAQPTTARWETRPALRTGELFEALAAAQAAQDGPAMLRALEEHRDCIRMVGTSG